MNYEVTYRDLAKAVDRHRFLCKELGFRFSEMAISGQWNCMGSAPWKQAITEKGME
jgi:hypothetical protein